MTNKKLKKIKYTVLIFLFIITAILTYTSMNFRREIPVSTTMQEATLPVIMMKTEAGTLYNQLHGYTAPINAKLLNDCITPLPDDKKLNIVINHYGEVVKSLSYKVRKLEDMSLIEDTKVSGYTAKNDVTDIFLNIKNLIENNTEYLLEIVLETEKHETVSYYTKIIAGTSMGLQEKLDFVLNFNYYVFHQEDLDKIEQWIETKSSGDNTNYGKVNIYSSQAQIGWGDLNPVVERDIIPSVKEIDNEVASIFLEYQMAAKGDNEIYDLYYVDEYYRIRQTATAMYLLNFEREADQVFDSRNDLMQSSRIRMGIRSNDELNMRCSLNGKYSCIITDGALWCLFDGDNTFTKIFSFESEDSDNVRELYNKYDIRIMEVSDEGTVQFIVYGYMNRGEHEGEVGVSLYQYDYEENKVDELLYLPVSVPFEVLRENVGEVSYISENKVFNFLLDNSLYSIDLGSKERMVEVSGLHNETYAVSKDGSLIAYSENNSPYDTDTIQIFNMESGSVHEIHAPAGDKLKIIGYINSDLIYGIVHESDILKEANGIITFPMYRIEIIDSDFNPIKEYQIEGVYINDAFIVGMRINLDRVVKNAEGNYEGIVMDQILNRDENQIENILTADTVITEARKKEIYINLVNKVTDTDKAVMRTSQEVVFTTGERVEIKTNFEDKGEYFVYGFGKFRGRFSNLAAAVIKANDTYGMVLDSDSQYLWRRNKDTNRSLTIAQEAGEGTASSLEAAVKILLSSVGYDADVTSAFAQGMSAIDVINQYTGRRALNLKGASAENVLYYIHMGMPVVGRTGDNSYVVLTAYDSQNIVYYDCTAGKSVTMLIADANKLFTQWGNVFISLM